ncbi:MAG: 2Fe-2S iron-sulfur cluster-binding protein [Marinovum sp.]|nr:2Fe-2S iron-sulfur cluster-binding protein [Marinovum sp.]
MATFHPLTVTSVRKTIPDAVEVTLAFQSGDFAFRAGQYLTFRHGFDGTELRRSYSICAAEGDMLQVGIKRVDGGAFSTWANTNLEPGMVIEAMPPMGTFTTQLQDSPRHLLFFAGGSGITPVLSLMRTVLRSEPEARVTLVYANRGVHTIMFREELEALKNRHMGRVTILHVLESGSDEIDLFRGRVDGDKCAALFAQWIDLNSVSEAFICGPEPMMLAIKEALQSHGLDDDQIRFELFKSAQHGRLERPEGIEFYRAKGIPAEVTLDGMGHSFTLNAEDTLLDAARAAAIDAPYACKAGVCSTCKCRVLEGSVQMAANHALEDDEVRDGYALSCQAFVTSDRIVVSYDV